MWSGTESSQVYGVSQQNQVRYRQGRIPLIRQYKENTSDDLAKSPSVCSLSSHADYRQGASAAAQEHRAGVKEREGGTLEQTGSRNTTNKKFTCYLI